MAMPLGKILNAVQGRLEKLESALPTVLTAVGGALVLIMMLVITGDALSRDFLNSPWPEVEPVASVYLMPAVAFLPLAYVQLRKGHISVGLFHDRLPPRAQAILDILIWSAALGLFAIISWKGLELLLWSLEASESSPSLTLPMWPGRVLLPAGTIALCLGLIMDILRNIKRACGVS